MFTNKSQDVKTIPVLFLLLGQQPCLCCFLSSLSSVSLSMGCHGGLEMITSLSLPCDLSSMFPSVFAIICLFFLLLSGVMLSCVLKFSWWPAHVSVCHCACVWMCPMPTTWFACRCFFKHPSVTGKVDIWQFADLITHLKFLPMAHPSPCSWPHYSIFSQLLSSILPVFPSHSSSTCN